jgi:hypothetical protein
MVKPKWTFKRILMLLQTPSFHQKLDCKFNGNRALSNKKLFSSPYPVKGKAVSYYVIAKTHQQSNAKTLLFPGWGTACWCAGYIIVISPPPKPPHIGICAKKCVSERCKFARGKFLPPSFYCSLWRALVFQQRRGLSSICSALVCAGKLFLSRLRLASKQEQGTRHPHPAHRVVTNYKSESLSVRALI